MIINVRDKRGLDVVPKYSFDVSHLKKEENLDFEGIFSDQKIKDMWNIDQESIVMCLGKDGTSGGINPGDRRALYSLIAALKPQNVLEVGTHIGASTLYISSALKHAGENAKLTTVDILDVNAEDAPWKKLGLQMSPRDFASKLGCADSIEFKATPAQLYMQDTKNRFDFIFLDGDHSSQAVYKEVSMALKLLNPGGVILLHDYYPDAKPLFSNGVIIPGPFRALDRIARENAGLYAKPLGQLPWPTKLGGNVTSLAVVTKQA